MEEESVLDSFIWFGKAKNIAKKKVVNMANKVCIGSCVIKYVYFIFRTCVAKYCIADI